MKQLSFSTLVAILLLSGCNENSSDTNESTLSIDDELQILITTHNLTGDPSTNRDLPSIESAKAQLGMKLFFTKALGGNQDSACVTCHHPMLGGGDNLSLPVGVDAVEHDLLGVGRVHSPSAVNYDGFAPVPRNAPSTFNLGLWDQVLFWDGRVEALNPVSGQNGAMGAISTPDSGYGVADSVAGSNLAAAQARFPVTSPEEMRSFNFEVNGSNEEIRAHLVSRLTDVNATDYIANTWADEMKSVYGEDGFTFNNIADAIAEYERSQVFVNTPWKAYVEGNTSAISPEAKEGAKLFFTKYEDGGLNCVSCHSGDFFTDEKFYATAIPQVWAMVKGNGEHGDDDFGRENVSGEGKYAFRTPTLLNVSVTGPWGHGGAYVNLRDVVVHMVNPTQGVENFDTSKLADDVKTAHTTVNTAAALVQLDADRASDINPLIDVEASEEQIDQLMAFLETLNDPCVTDRECMSKWIPANEAGLDGLQLNAKDKEGNLL